MIATLITLSLFKGIALLLVQDGVSAIKSGGDLKMPDWINWYGREGVLLKLPAAFWVAVVVTLVLVTAQNRTLLGKYAAATGGNLTAAKLSGINTGAIVVLLYVIVGVVAALAGIARSSFMSLGDPLSGDGMELTAILQIGTAGPDGPKHPGNRQLPDKRRSPDAGAPSRGNHTNLKVATFCAALWLTFTLPLTFVVHRHETCLIKEGLCSKKCSKLRSKTQRRVPL